MSDLPPEPDRLGDAPHPRETARLFGQDAAEATFLDAWNSARLHHGWLLTGPRGVGKATLAWRIARFLLTDPPLPAPSLDPPAGHPALPRIAALSEPGLMLLRRPWDEKAKRLKQDITVDEVRRLGGFFGLSAGGRRVVLVDAADDLNPSAANAILKLLEEPPKRATLLLVAQKPAGLLPTIRSRCRVLRLGRLDGASLAQAVAQAGGDESGLALADGSVGAALSLGAGGAEIYAQLVALFASRQMDRGAARRMADACAGRQGSDRLQQTLDAIDRLMHRAARAGLLGMPEGADSTESQALARLSPHDVAARAWATLAQQIADRAAHARAVNVDAAAIVWDALAAIDVQARKV
ncbi:DNA polymerase III subunit delta' [Jannaschia seohaensis]|uniref:DNA polymerase-3 subunit delta n=1 Tax=Jannaschia seohaensis TaxID=475081 RepID=A0A2Y9C772_9RHOB|nr:DNA polymerase III subunit delta' [Jannaschia seohaensis]PWJ20487.1 DNA polymerase-3 subunit delta' [Jannaschia seohaensis]SSA44583.1 DNA polymerase-3 subunit delta' [Jannaschia seohaensis]